MISFPNAKINLGLNIISKREDGYHNLETVFYPINLSDALEIVPSESNEQYRFFQTGIEIKGEAEDNLVIKALKLISEEKQIPPIDIHLLKKIPFGAGLGGGSSDAAFMLKLLNEKFDLKYSEMQLMRLATKLGADCAFFIKNRPAFASGIGDELEDIDLDLTDYFFVLIKPDIFVPTKDAYSMILPAKPDISLKEIVKKTVSGWKDLMKNDFEKTIFKKYPEIETIKQKLYNMGAVYASMSGSGSAVYGFFKEVPHVKNQFGNNFVWTNF